MYSPSSPLLPSVLLVSGDGRAAIRSLDDFDLIVAPDRAGVERLLADRPPDAVVIDCLADPVELLGELAARAPEVACVVVDRSAAPARVEAALEAGADAYLVAPLQPGQLAATLATALRSRTRGQAIARKLVTYRARIEEMIDRAPVPMFVKDAAGRYRFTNDAFHRYVGMSKEEVIGRRDRELIGAEGAADLEASDRLILAGRESHESERDHDLAGERRVYCVTKFPFRDDEGNIVGIAGVATDITERERNEAVLIEAAFEQDRLIDQLRRSRAETVDRLTLALRKRDIVSGQHVSRMAVVAAWLGELHGLPPHRVMLLRSAAPMHDVGKIAIRDEILQKPAPLTMEERAEMERHARIGFEILDGSSSAVLNLGAIVALTHHENFDGSGYPRGLRGIEIPIEGRICAVADVFDALLSDRPYRPAMSVAVARETLAEGRGRFFDPEILDLLLDHFDEACAMREEAGRSMGPAAT